MVLSAELQGERVDVCGDFFFFFKGCHVVKSADMDEKRPKKAKNGVSFQVGTGSLPPPSMDKSIDLRMRIK